MNLTIDFGNTSIKAARFEGHEMLQYYEHIHQIELLQILNAHPEYQLMVCSVNQESTHFINLIEHKERLQILDYKTRIPIVNTYGSPNSLGMDRLAAVTGASALFPNEDLLVIDAGTCITYDFINSAGEYLGGSICPGIQMKYKALKHFTSKLPLVEQRNIEELTARNTEDAIASGVLYGSIGEMKYIIDYYLEKYPAIQIIMCGGDARFFETKIKHHIFVVPELVLVGLNRILIHNAV